MEGSTTPRSRVPDFRLRAEVTVARAEAAIVGRRASHRRLAGHRDGEPIEGSGAERSHEVVEQMFGIGPAMQITASATMPVLTAPAVQPSGGRAGSIDEITPKLRTVREDDMVEPAGNADLYAALSTIFLQDSVRRSASALAGARRRHRPGRRRNFRRPTARGAAGSGPVAAAVDVPTAGAVLEARMLEALVTLADTLVAGHGLTSAMSHLVDVCAEFRHGRTSVVVKDQLQQALSGHVVIEEAKGVLAEFGGLDMDEAFAELRASARRHRLGVTELAQDLVDRRRSPGDILRAPSRRLTTPHAETPRGDHSL